MSTSLSHFQPNPSYGHGIYRRLVRLSAVERRVLATVDDTHHAMWLVLDHDGVQVTAIECGIERGPATSCSGAPANLTDIVGAPIDLASADFAHRLPPGANCTHLSDLLRWAMRAAQGPGGEIEYEISVPDQMADPVWIEIKRSGLIVHRWLVKGETIQAPALLAGRPLFRGFLAWARAAFGPADLEAGIMLQRGAWVARGLRYVVDRTSVPLSAAAGMQGACFSYSGENWRTARNNLNYVRDFTAGVVEQENSARLRARLEGNSHDPI